MKDTLRERCELFVGNRDRIKAAFGWESAYIYPLCAAIYTARGATADTAIMKDCLGLLKQRTGAFSNFRGTTKMAIVSKLALCESPGSQLERMMAIYDGLKELFWGSQYLAVAAVTIAELSEPGREDDIVQRTRTIYNHMKEAHPFLTSGEDSAFAALLALSGLDDRRIEQEMELCYSILKPSFFSANAVQSLSHILALGEADAHEKCAKTMDLFDYLKSRGHRYGAGYELSTLGALALLDASAEQIGEDMIAADDYLKGQKGFGAFGIGARQRLLYAGMLAMDAYIPEVSTIQAAALNGVVSLVIAQQAAMCAAIAASAAAASSSSSS